MSASSSSSAVVASGSSGRSSAASSGVAVSSAAALDPAGYLRGAAGESVFSLSTPSDGSDRGAYEAQAWERAKAQAAGVAQTGFTLYMFVGNQLALFNLIFLFTFGMQPIANLLATGKSACAAAAARAAAGFAPGPRPRCAAASTYPFFSPLSQRLRPCPCRAPTCSSPKLSTLGSTLLAWLLSSGRCAPWGSCR